MTAPAAWAHLPPAVCVVVIAPDGSGRVLMVQRAKPDVGEGYWTPITGRVESGESLEQAAKREVHEEVGLTVEPLEVLWHCPTSIHSHLLHWFVAKLVGQDTTLPRIEPAEAEIRDWRWVRPEEAATLEPTFEDTRQFFATFAGRLDELARRGG